ncbi:MAG: NADH-quinone oxidoreductase subunit J [Archaeoglobaceae archaeon]
MIEIGIFWVMAAITAVSAMLIFASRDVLHSATFFALTMFLIGGIYVLLESYFLAFIHIMVYAGAVSVLIVFAIMVTRGGGIDEL